MKALEYSPRRTLRISALPIVWRSFDLSERRWADGKRSSPFVSPSVMSYLSASFLRRDSSPIKREEWGSLKRLSCHCFPSHGIKSHLRLIRMEDLCLFSSLTTTTTKGKARSSSDWHFHWTKYLWTAPKKGERERERDLPFTMIRSSDRFMIFVCFFPYFLRYSILLSLSFSRARAHPSIVALRPVRNTFQQVMNEQRGIDGMQNEDTKREGRERETQIRFFCDSREIG